jgi:hypothetical protein
MWGRIWCPARALFAKQTFPHTVHRPCARTFKHMSFSSSMVPCAPLGAIGYQRNGTFHGCKPHFFFVTTEAVYYSSSN